MRDAFQLIIKSAIDNCSVACLSHKVYVARRQRALYLHKKRRWKQLRHKPTDKNMARYIQASKHLTKTINRNHICTDNALLRKNSHQFFRHVSKVLNATDHTITLRGSNDQAILSDLEICDALATEFSQNFSSSSYPDVVIGPTAESLFQVEFNVHALHKILRGLPNFAARPDGIPAAVYKRLATVLVRPLHLIFSQSLMQGVLPSA